MNSRPPRLFCFGFGYCALRLAERLMAQAWPVAGTCRGADKQAALAARGLAVHLFDGTKKLAAPAVLDGVTHLLCSAPPGATGDPVLAQHGADIAALAGLRWLGYLSATSVYGDRGGGWVDETSPPAPTGPRGRARLAAEAQWRALWQRQGIPVHVFRLAGIYGPGRSAFDDLRRGTARRIVKPGQMFSRIHVDDVATILAASMALPVPGAVYNLCDDAPAPQAEVVAYAARLLGMAPPPELPFDDASLSPAARSFHADNKRVSNARVTSALGVRLAYPDYRAGLAAILAAQR